MSPNSKLNLIYWNPNGILNKTHELYHHMITNYIDIACISETFLKTNSNPPSHPDFLFHRLDRTDRQRGGVAIVINRAIQHQLLPDLNLSIIEAIGIQVEINNNNKLQIYAIYLPGGSSNSNINRHFASDIKKLTNRRISYFICGDFNSKHRFWNCNIANRVGTLLYEVYNRNNFAILHPPTSTHFPVDSRKIPSTIDLVLTNGIHDHTVLTSIPLSSDHNAVEFSVEHNGNRQITNQHLIRNYKKANWEKYKLLVERNLTTHLPTSTTNTDEIENLVTNLSYAIKYAENLSVPLIKPTEYALQLSPQIVTMIKLRNIFIRQWQRTRRIDLKTSVNRLSKKIKLEINEIRNMNWSAKLSQIQPNNRDLYQTTKFLKKRNRLLPPLNVNNKILLTAQEKADALATQFENSHLNPLNNCNPAFTKKIKDEIDNFIIESLPINDDFYVPSIVLIKSIIIKLKNTKAPGKDRIHNTLLKKLPHIALQHIRTIIKLCFQNCCFPMQWKHAEVIPIHKPGKDPTSPSSYRPISLLSSLSKIMERVILFQINDHIEDNNILPKQQFGFRQKFSTVHQLHRIITHGKDKLKNKESTGMLLMDVEKAFDRVWHDGLIHKMIKFEFPNRLIKLIYSFLSNRQFHVKVLGKNSITKELKYGVAQGAVLSPTLYNLFTADIPQHLNNVEIALFADDTAIFCSSRFSAPIVNSLKSAMTRLQRYFTRWKIKSNSSKTQAIFFTRRRTRELPGPTITIDHVEIQRKTEAKYLGMILDKTMTLNKHVDYAVEKSNKIKQILFPLINRASVLDQWNKLMVYKQIIRPALTYGCPLFPHIAPTNIKKMQIFQNKIIKMILNQSRFTRTQYIHDETEIPYIEEYIKKLNDTFNSRLIHYNELFPVP